MAEPERRRRRPAVSCALCKKRKIRCNREYPCSNCVRSRNGTCVYENHPPQPPPQHSGQARVSVQPQCSTSTDQASSVSTASTVPSHLPNFSAASSTTGTSPTSQSSGLEVESLKSRIRQLEEQLSKATLTTQYHAPTSTSGPKTTTSPIIVGNFGTFHVHHDGRSFGHTLAITRSVTHKTRLFGQSHWINGIAMFRDICEMIEPHIREETSKAFSGVEKCKRLAKLIKSRQKPSWPSPPTSDLPPKEVADELVDCYLRTTETFYRVLHVPTFRRDYEALWVADTEPDKEFLVQLKLVLAIGATTYDQEFSLRASAIQWVYEAQTWLSEPNFKSRLNIQSLQTCILLLVARETAGVCEDLVWISAGALVRTAVYMGLHTDPNRLPQRTNLAAEMRRRLWITILEINLQSSMTSGGPPLISLDDFDTSPPGNFDDDQLVIQGAVPKSEDVFTQMSIAIALHKTFPLRLAIAKFLNDIGSQGTYEQTLRLDAELRASYKALRRTLQSFKLNTGLSSQFGIQVADVIMNRYLSSLHIPFFSLSWHETACAFSRKVMIETALKIWFTTYPSTSIMAAQSRSDIAAPGRNDLERLTISGSGFFRYVALQATLVIAVELKTQLQEEETLGPVPLRPDLLSVLEDAKAWSLRCIEAGECNIKGYLLTCIIAAQIEGLMRGLGKDDFPELLVKAAEEVCENCLPMLERITQGQTEGVIDGLDPMSLNMTAGLLGDWDFMMSDTQYNLDDAEPMSWFFNDKSTQELSLW